MTKVYVYRNFKNGNKRKIIWATFKLEIDAHIFADKVKANNPTWLVTTSN
jgi:hypothetical protein